MLKNFKLNKNQDVSIKYYQIEKNLFDYLISKFRDAYDFFIRRTFYKYYYKNFFTHQTYKIDIVLPSKGFSDEARKNKLNKIKNIKNKSILLIGCGNGFDILNWIKFNPKNILAIDILNYEASWKKVKKFIQKKSKSIELEFKQIDILKLNSSSKFDFIVSDAVFEHLKDFKRVISFCKKILKKNGIIYASYGPLWHNYGGDHFSGRDKVENGFNHILLNKKKYNEYYKNNVGNLDYEINYKGSGGLLVKKDLFSKLLPNEYMKFYKKNDFQSLFTAVEFCPIGYKLIKKNLDIRKKLIRKYPSIDIENSYLKSHIVYLRKAK